MIAGKASPLSKFKRNREKLGGWLRQLTDPFTNPGIRNEGQKLAFVGLSMEGKAFNWWKANKDKYSSWAAVQNGIELYYADHYRTDSAHLEIHARRQTDTVQDSWNEIDRLNTYAKIPDRAKINNSINKLTSSLWCSMADNVQLHENPNAWSK